MEINKIKKNFKNQKGQLMIIMAVLMAGAFLVGTAIAGLLLYFSVSQASDVISSNAALFAADAGIEDGLYNYFKSFSNLEIQNICNKPDFSISGDGSLNNGSSYTYTIKFECSGDNPISFYIKSVGKAASAERILQQFFDLQ